MKSIINAKELSYSIPYSRNIYQEVTFELSEGEIFGLLGVNGSGKTTLIDIILGQRTNYTGEIKVLNEVPNHKDRLNASQVAFISQDITLPGFFKVEEYSKFMQELYSNYDLQLEAEFLKKFNLNKEIKIGSLSTGQQRKVQIITALAAKPKLLIIDEITAVLDPEARDIFFNLLIECRSKYSLSAILATNIAEDLINIADKILFIKDQKIIQSSPQNILKLFNVVRHE